MLAPIILFTYHRLDHLRKTVEALSQNSLARDSELIVYSDGARSKDLQSSVNHVRRFIKRIDSFRKVTVIESAENRGLAQSIINGVTETFQSHNSAVILEDDMITSPGFLRFINNGLETLEREDQVASVHGYSLPIQGLPDNYFLRGADCWGWGTWKRAWQHFEPNSKRLLYELESKGLTKQFDLDGGYPYTQMLRDHVVGKNDSWAIRWHASVYLKNMLTLYPGRTLVQNIGLDNSGTHCVSDCSISPPVSELPVDLRDIEIGESVDARNAISAFWKQRNRRTFLGRIQRIMSLWAKQMRK